MLICSPCGTGLGTYSRPLRRRQALDRTPWQWPARIILLHFAERWDLGNKRFGISSSPRPVFAGPRGHRFRVCGRSAGGKLNIKSGVGDATNAQALPFHCLLCLPGRSCVSFLASPVVCEMDSPRWPIGVWRGLPFERFER